MIRRLAWLLAGALLLAAATAPFWVHLPAPRGAQAIGHASLLDDAGGATRVDLPHAWPQRGGRAEYRLEFTLDAVPQEPLYLFIPLLAQRAVLTLDGQQVLDTSNRARMAGVASGQAAFAMLPRSHVAEGRNTVHVAVETERITPGYLSQAWVGTAEQLGPHYRLRIFLLEHLRLMVLATQVLITIAVLLAWLYRPREPLFAWILAVLAITLAGYAGLFVDLHPRVPELLPYAFLVGTTGSLLLLVVPLLTTGTAPPRWLWAAAIGVPGTCILLALAGVVPASALALAAGAPLTILAPIAATGIALWGAWVKKSREAALLLLPLALQALAAVHDGAVALRIVQEPVFLALYYRAPVAIGIAVLLMRRLGLSLAWLDDANAHLLRRLAERERELSRLHAAEREEAEQRVRDEERRRLTLDLHDGVGGHLASIVALAEREQAASIARTAREALDDLRIVIHALDIGDRELPVALAGLHERLARSTKRLGIALDWSIAKLPEISGVTPSHALNVQRILQEAVANAIRHGPATRIEVRGEADPQGGARIVVENDGAPFAWRSGGHGLANMRARAAQLGGGVTIEAVTPRGTRVVLTLPTVLPAQARQA